MENKWTVESIGSTDNGCGGIESCWSVSNGSESFFINDTEGCREEADKLCELLNRLSRPVTDAEIDAMFPISKNSNIGQVTQQYAKREGAKALRDKLEGKG